MILISMISVPPESAREMVKRSMQLPRLPEYIKTQGPLIHSAVGEGLRTIVLYEFEDSKFTEASQQIGKLMGAFYGVPGFTYSLEVWFRAKDAFEFTVLPENLWAKK
jgi:hypothetical protein